MLIGSLVELHVGLHSWLCFSHLEKLFLKAGSTPPRYLLDSWLSVELPPAFSYRNLACTSIPGGSIEIGSVCSIASRYLVDRSGFCSIFWCVDPRYLLDTSAVDKYFLDTSSTDISIHVDTCICRDLLAFLYKASARSGSHFHRSFSWCFSVSLPKTLQSHSYFGSQGFCKVFQVFSSLGKLLILSHSCISCFET